MSVRGRGFSWARSEKIEEGEEAGSGLFTVVEIG